MSRRVKLFFFQSNRVLSFSVFTKMKTIFKACIVILFLLSLDIVIKSCRKEQTFHYRYTALGADFVAQEDSLTQGYINIESDTVHDGKYFISCAFKNELTGRLYSSPGF